MSITALNRIPHISVEQISDTFIRITAPDGFALNCTRVDRMNIRFWQLDPAGKVTDITHFNLRYLINQALNS